MSDQILAREQARSRISKMAGGRTVQWLDTKRRVYPSVEYDKTLEVFGADDPEEQVELLHRFQPIRPELEKALGGALSIVFHKKREREPTCRLSEMS